MKRLFTNSPTEELKPWEKVGVETTLAKKYGLSLISQNFMNPQAGEEEEYVFCRKIFGFTVLPVLANGNVVITRTFKHGVNKVVWEFPAGMNMQERGEALDLAKVELSEESGLRAKRIVYLGSTSTAPRKFDTVEHLYIGLDCEVLPPGPKPNKGEILEVWALTPEELWSLLRQWDGSLSGFSEMAVMRAVDMGLLTRP